MFAYIDISSYMKNFFIAL